MEKKRSTPRDLIVSGRAGTKARVFAADSSAPPYAPPASPPLRVVGTLAGQAESHADRELRILAERVKDGDAEAFSELYRRTRVDVARTLTKLLGRRPDLEDLVQDTFIRLHRAIPTYRGEARFRTFLYRVCANVALMQLRWWRRRPEVLTDEPPELPSTAQRPDDAAFARQAERLVHQAVASLSAKKRVVFVFHELCGMGPEEIAEATGTTYNTVRSRLLSARQDFTVALRALVKEDAP